jgi:PKD repeat protein
LRIPATLPVLLLALALAASARSLVAAPVATITAPVATIAGQAGYAASVPAQAGTTYLWSIAGGTIIVGAASESVAFAAGAAGTLSLTCRVTDAAGVSSTGTATVAVQAAPPPAFNLQQALSDGAQRTTLAFDGLGMITGNLEAQSFFPPGKVADYWGFQYLRDNDPDDMGHNTSFLTRIACNVLSILSDEQLGWLKNLAASQVASINQYAYERYPLMKAFRRLADADVPAGSSGLSATAVKATSRNLYLIDGQISFDRAVLYARLFRSLTAAQKAYLGAMAGKGWKSWPDRTMDDVRTRTVGLSNDEVVAVTTYASDLFSWYVGSLDGDVYICPERQGTYFGSFYMKDAPAIGHEGYGIDEQLTVTAGTALCDSSRGFVTAQQAAIVAALVEGQRSNLYTGTPSIVTSRRAISAALRSLIASTEPSTADLEKAKATVLEQSALYGELDGENVAAYATAFARVSASLTASQKANLLGLRRSFMSGKYADGTPFDFTTCSTPFLYAAVIKDPATLAPYISNTDYLFATAGAPGASFRVAPEAPVPGQPAQLTDTSTGSPTSWSWTFGDDGASSSRNPAHTWGAAGSYTVTLTASNASGSSTASRTVNVSSAAPAACTADVNTLCLVQNRFAVQVAFKDYAGSVGEGRAQVFSADSGYFWFFDQGNIEVVAKMVNSCSYGSGFSVYASGLTDVETTLKVTDTKYGTSREFKKPLGQRFTTIAEAPFSCP